MPPLEESMAPARARVFDPAWVTVPALTAALGGVRYAEVTANRPLGAIGGVLIPAFFVAGAVLWTSLATAYARNTERGAGAWSQLATYLWTSLLLVPVALAHTWAVPLGLDLAPMTWIATLVAAKAIHVVVFGVVVWRRSGPWRGSKQ